jgi:hypothetical protein
VVAKFDAYAAVVHTGGLSWWEGLSGLSGGALSALWTPEAGSLLLGRVANRPFPDAERDAWSSVERWQTHALSGRTRTGKAFSTARVRGPTSELRIDERERSVTIRIRGALGPAIDEGRGCEDAALRGAAQHEVLIQLDAAGISLAHTLDFDPAEELREVWASLPVFERHPLEGAAGRERVRVEARAGDEWSPVGSEWGPPVRHIRLLRRSGGLALELPEAHRVRLSAPPGPFGRALLVELPLPTPGTSDDRPGTKFSVQLRTPTGPEDPEDAR